MVAFCDMLTGLEHGKRKGIPEVELKAPRLKEGPHPAVVPELLWVEEILHHLIYPK